MPSKRWSSGRLLLIFVMFTSSAQAFRVCDDMNWAESPKDAWPHTENQAEFRVVLLLLNKNNYTGDKKDWKFIASGALLDNSRILTSYNPFRQLLSDPKTNENILALIPTACITGKVHLQISNLVCARQIAYVPDDKNYIWRDKKFSPLHDLMVIRIEEEIGIATASFRVPPFLNYQSNQGNFWWSGELGHRLNGVKSFPAGMDDVMDPEVHIFTLGYKSRKQMRDFDEIHEIVYEADDAALVDCDEWLPRQWGFFICIQNIGNFPGLGSGALLFSKNKLFGIGSFGMFKMDKGILVFTDVRPYKELIEKTCGDEEFD